MILRRPFAFFIKHFKLFHFIMLLFMIYVMYSSSAILSYLNEYLNSTMVLINHEVITTLYSNLLFVSIFFIFLFTIVILFVMLFKKKPVKYYFFNILAYIFVVTIIIISRNTLSTLEISLVEVRTLKLIQDLVLMTILIQSITCIMTAIRATGFNIKKFDFAKDLEELDIDEKDSEEFEVSFELDNDKFLRKLNKVFRYIKYIYVENKYLFSIISALLIGIICIIIYLNQTIYNKVYKENENLTTKDFYFNIVESYVTNKDYRGNVIDKNYSFVISRVKVRTINSKNKILSTAQIALHVNDHNIYPITDYRTEFSDLGISYNNDEISNAFSEYLLVYKIPNSYVDSKMLMYYFDTNLKTIKVKINPNKIDEDIKENYFNLNDNISLEKSIFKNSSINIYSYELSNSFDVTYNFCISNECRLSHEIISPKLNTNYDKALLKITGSYNIDQNLSILKPQKLYYLLEKFGSIIYNLNGKEYTVNQLYEILPTKTVDKNVVYLEVPRSIIDASEIKFKIKIRNMSYVYILK